MKTVFTNCLVFDGTGDTLRRNLSVVVDGEHIADVTRAPPADDVDVIDCGGRVLMPGLIDLHFHAYSASFDMIELDRMPASLLASYAVKHLEDAAQRGFTSVRDPGGGDVGLALAIERGLVAGPRFFYGGKALSQTGGHGDMRPGTHAEICNCAYSGVICRVVDGVDEVRRIARNELRKGAHHIKVFISGGIASPTDPVWMPQFTDAEIRAAVEEAASRRKYVVAHCHTDDGARRCLQNGVRSIDHATHVTPETASMIADSGTTFVVPTLAVIHEILDCGQDAGLPRDSIDKVGRSLELAHASIEACRKAGVGIGLGTDIFGTAFHDMQASEFRYRAAVEKPIDILRSATSVNAEIMQRGAELGRVAKDYLADLILLDRNPLEDPGVFERFRTEMPLVMRGGALLRNDLP